MPREAGRTSRSKKNTPADKGGVNLSKEMLAIIIGFTIVILAGVAFGCHQWGKGAGYEDGYSTGYSAGETTGYDNGYKEGEEDGYDDGYKEGSDEGYKEGEDDGYDKGCLECQKSSYDEGYRDGWDTAWRKGWWTGCNNCCNRCWWDCWDWCRPCVDTFAFTDVGGMDAPIETTPSEDWIPEPPPPEY